jgi:hypothetical protein
LTLEQIVVIIITEDNMELVSFGSVLGTRFTGRSIKKNQLSSKPDNDIYFHYIRYSDFVKDEYGERYIVKPSKNSIIVNMNPFNLKKYVLRHNDCVMLSLYKSGFANMVGDFTPMFFSRDANGEDNFTNYVPNTNLIVFEHVIQ